MQDLRTLLDRELNKAGGLLRLKPTFVARDLYPALGRLGLKDPSAGERGWLCERWIASCVEADNPIPVKHEGLSFIVPSEDEVEMSFLQALALRPERLLGKEYAGAHQNRFGVLTKLLDIGLPIPWHLHAGEEDARRYWGKNPKEEAYYFLEVDNPGPLPYSHLGVHPDVNPEDLLPLLQRWDDDKVLDLSPAYRLNVGEGFHIFPGVPHAPGTALTLEIQEESDVYNVFQAVYYGRRFSKEALLLRGLPDERAALRLIDWEKSKRPDFYRAYHTVPERIRRAEGEEEGTESWVFSPQRTRKFSGKEVRIPPGKTFRSQEPGAYAFFLWKGEGSLNGQEVRAGDPSKDEVFVTAELATRLHVVTNTGREEMVFYKIFGPDVSG